MPSQQQIERFTLAFHRVAVDRLRRDPALKREALRVLDRWEVNGASASGKRYRDEWRLLLQSDPDALEHAVCSPGEHAATLRGVSPLGFLIEEPERLEIRRQAMAV
jgi:hypothetical protein